jgi:hypothetical protein
VSLAVSGLLGLTYASRLYPQRSSQIPVESFNVRSATSQVGGPRQVKPNEVASSPLHGANRTEGGESPGDVSVIVQYTGAGRRAAWNARWTVP